MLVKPVEILLVLLCSEEIEASDFEVGKELTIVVLSVLVHKPIEVSVGV